MNEDDEEALGISLATMYCCLAFVSLVQILRIIVNGHNLASFQSIFLVLVFVWMSLRGFFFGSSFDMGNLAVDLVLWIPYSLQFTTFSLILVFYAKLFYQQDWPQNKPVVWGAFAVANCLAIGLTLGVIAKSCSKQGEYSCVPDDKEEKLFSRTIGIAYLLLTLIYSYFGVALVASSRSRKISVPNIQGPCKLAVVTAMAWLIFLTRGLYDFVKTYGFWEMNITTGEQSGINIQVFLLYFFWEVFPTFVILYYFRHIPSSRHPVRCVRWCRNHFLYWCCCDETALGSRYAGTFPVASVNGTSGNDLSRDYRFLPPSSSTGFSAAFSNGYPNGSGPGTRECNTPRSRIMTEEDDAMCKSIWDEQESPKKSNLLSTPLGTRTGRSQKYMDFR
mmetsp:Transcript_27508/g.66906  ORF Transcript_27508/g.66906 Transcript_27508/m.66906 type:complete len:390 (+) Transcript_27508:152-1321(+)